MTIAHLAIGQMYFEQRLDETDMVFNAATVTVDGLQQRGQALEGILVSDKVVVISDEAKQID